MSQQVRVRFAPSPTGPLHIGGVRTALFNYLFAKKHSGSFILRIEDTDQNRYVEGAEQYIIDSLNWCGIPFDEGPGKDGGYGPYRQSERQHIYKAYADELVAKGKAYYAFDTSEELQAMRQSYEAKGETFIYNWHNRETLNNSLALSSDQVEAKIKDGIEHVVRFKSPAKGQLILNDLIRGKIEIDTSLLDDKILFKSDGMPTYHLANIVDDHLMQISHVIRGEEWLPSLALHQLLYDAFGWKAPQFAHLPLILKPTGKGKLSKRDGDKLGFPVFPLEWRDPSGQERYHGYREDGYFSEAVINFLAFLGWNPGSEQEIFSREELVSAFNLERVQKGGARFDPDKTKWFNHHYMQEQNDRELAIEFKANRPELNEVDLSYIELVVALIKERATFVSDFWQLSHFMFVSPGSFDEKGLKKAVKEGTSDILTEICTILSEIEPYNTAVLNEKIKGWITEKEIGFGRVMMPLRLALVGSLQGPDVFEIMFLIGKNESVRRIETAIKTLNRST
ncbi:MAG: glutamate--tRNA ligase [Flavobacteriaceae bacterium]|nr:glutamate--tRNA ligase [Bacteroidia bacterium]NNF75150.1 glutamate--tRNA ligase [Flavobacteriaceae bacterium]NNK72166.1 glutamate--tRNA ligase [Flavobacteriaceae bacterium]